MASNWQIPIFHSSKIITELLLCDILPNVGFKGELVHGKHATAMLNQACKLPKENTEEIVNRGLDKLGLRHPNPVLESCGIHVGMDMAVMPGHVLKKPGLATMSADRERA